MQLSTELPCQLLYPQENNPYYPFYEGWVAQISWPCMESDPKLSILQLRHYTNNTIPSPNPLTTSTVFNINSY